MVELENYLNDLLITDTIIFSLSLRNFFQFDKPKKLAKKNKVPDALNNSKTLNRITT